jgi:hypothetical protein
MSTLYVTEYNQPEGAPGAPQAPVEPAILDQTVPIGGASAASAAFNSATNIVRLESDVVCSVVFGTAPTATTGNQRIAAGVPEYKRVKPGAGLKVAVISNT